jgi:K+-sensing histidine kinase KdpD
MQNRPLLACCVHVLRQTSLCRFQLSIFPTATRSSAILVNGGKLREHMHSNEQKETFLTRSASFSGAAIGVLAAGGASLLAAGHPWHVWVPLVFSVVLLVIALSFGTRAGVWATLLSALVFAVLLFSPIGSFRVIESTARANLGWMLLAGLAFSLLLAPPTHGLRKRSSRTETTHAGPRAS